MKPTDAEAQAKFYNEMRRELDESYVGANQILNTVLNLRVRASMLEIQLASMYGSLERHLHTVTAINEADQAGEPSNTPENVDENK